MTSVNRRARCRLRFSWWVLLVICSKGVDSSYVICSEGAMTGSGPPVSELKTESSLDPCSVGPLGRIRSRKVKPSQSSSSVQQSSQVMAVDRHPATLAVYTQKITHFSVFTVFILDSCYCRMTNCELLHWLVKMLSRDIHHYRMLNESWSTVQLCKCSTVTWLQRWTVTWPGTTVS